MLVSEVAAMSILAQSGRQVVGAIEEPWEATGHESSKTVPQCIIEKDWDKSKKKL